MILPLLALAAAQASLSETDPARFQACAALVRSDAQAALAHASEWRIRGGGLAARQCLGLAYVALERWPSAATVYEQAAREAEQRGDPRRIEFWAQAGNAWLAAEEPTRALQAFDAVLSAPSLAPETRGLVHLDRARALVDLGNAAAARADIQRALELAPGDPFGWYLSAALARREGEMDRAAADIARALAMAPEEPDILLLAGTIAGLRGDTAEARRLYERAAARPGSPAAEAARAALTSGPQAPEPAAEE